MMAALSQYDLRIRVDEEAIDLPLMLYRPEDKTSPRTGSRTAPPLTIVPQPLREGEAFYKQEQRALYNDGSGGAGYGERLALNVYHYGLPCDARQPGLFMPPGRLTELSMSGVPMQGPVYAFFEALDQVFAVGYRYAAILASGVGTPAVAKDFGVAFTAQSAVKYAGHGYVGGTGGPMWQYLTTDGSWHQSADVYRQYLTTVYWVRGNAGSEKLVGSTNPTAPGMVWPDRSIEYTDNANPMTEAVWSEEILVGNAEYSITNVKASNQHLYVLKSNGLHDLDDRLYSPNITSYRENQHDIINPASLSVHNGHVYFGSRRGLDRVSIEQQGIRQDRPQQCEFGFGQPNYSQIRGTPSASVAENGWLAVNYWDSITATSYLCYGIDYRDIRQSAPSIGGPMLWHGAIAVLPGVQVLSLYPCAPSGASYAPRLYIGGVRTSTNLATIHWLSLPQAGSPIQDLKAGGPMRFGDDMVVVFPRETYGNDVSRKDLTQIAIRGDNLGTATLSAYAAFEGGAFGSSLGSATSAYDVFSVDDPTNVRDLSFKVVGAGTATVPPILKALEAQAGVSVEANNIYTYVAEFGEGVKLATGGEYDDRDPFITEQTLLAIQGKRATVKDFRRQQQYEGRILQGIGLEWLEYPSGERTGRVRATIPFLAREGGWTLDSGRSLDSGLRVG